MENFVTNLFRYDSVAMAAVIGICAIWVITGVAQRWHLTRVAELEANLKRQMLDKGLSPAEIEQVLHASQQNELGVDFSGELDTDKAILVKLLSNGGYSGEDIELVLHAFAVLPQSTNAVNERTARAKAVQAMIENGNEAEDIERMLRAFHVRESERSPTEIQEIR